MTWPDYEDRYGESKADFFVEPEKSWEQEQADAAGVPLFGPL